MLVQGASTKKRTAVLVEKYCSLLEQGVKAEEVLVLLQNSVKKEHFVNTFKKQLKINHYENPQIHTFFGLCYNTVLNNWTVIENSINSPAPAVTPNLTGLEISRYLLNNAIQEADFKDYNSKLNLIHQLFRRHSLISNNNLSEQQVAKRSKVLQEVFAEDAQKALNSYKLKTIQYRAFDYLRQLNIFNHLYKNTECFKEIKYLIVDDADEITPAEFEFIKHLSKQTKETLIAYDRHGSSRLGFLNTDVKTVENIEKFFEKENSLNLDEEISPTVKPEHYSYTGRLEMIQKALERVNELISAGASPSEIAIITPEIDDSLRYAIREFFAPKNIEFQFLSGSEKLCETTLVKNCLSLLRYAIGLEVTTFDFRAILTEILNIPLKYCMQVVEEFKANQRIKYFDLSQKVYSAKLSLLLEVTEEIKNAKLSLSEKVYIIHEKLLFTQNSFATTKSEEYEKFLFFVKQIRDFEQVFGDYKLSAKFQKIILNQLSNSIISENPSDSPKIKENAIIISTAQKIIDYSYSTKHQLWLDTTSHEWMHDDFGMLYNAWVFQSSWNKDSFSNEDNLKFSDLKAKKMLRKLALLAQEDIYCYSSLYNLFGLENTDNIEDKLLEVSDIKKTEELEENGFNFSFTPRKDQKPVLDYEGGKMAISAVPGAGKTTILLALIIKLLKQGVAGENIFVLTYMDSAARNFKEKIKKACPKLEKLPNISTIHGLALRILKENTNYVKAGLDENFEVCDDTQRQKILSEVVNFCLGETDDFDKYDKGISLLKLSNLKKKPYTKDSELLKFLKVFYCYNSTLKSRNLIDYDDMLVLSVKLLEQNPDIAAYYQNICQYLIEDEAQDSSAIQQKLLSVLSKKHNNLIRCGDINQAITTTFTNTDLDGFKDFVNSSNNILMSQSQRCTKEVYELANNLVEYTTTEPLYKNAFYNVKMQEVPGKNPISSDAVQTRVFEDYNEERSYLLEKIRKIFSENKAASVAILVRNNAQTEEYTSYFANFGYNIITAGDTFEKQPAFNLLTALIKFCAHPWLNETVSGFARILKEQKITNFSENDFIFLKELKNPFLLCKDEDIPSAKLSQLLWDLNYWLENSGLQVEDFAIKAGLYYSSTEVEKANVYITAEFFKSVMSQYKDIDSFLNRLEEIKTHPIGQKFKFFEEESKENSENNGAIQIMTYHKSKGGEFDYVFIPSLNEDFLQFNPDSIKIKSKERFLESVKALNYDYKKKDEKELKLFQIEENFRLLYVAITRARKKLYLTTAKNRKKYSRIKKVEPSIVFEKLLNKSGVLNAR